jgi:hypothetical protein
MARDLQYRISDLRSAERRFEPDAAWIRATRENLLNTVSKSLPKEAVRPTRQVSHFFRHFVPPQFVQLLRAPVLASIFVFVAALGSSVASVSAAERSLPGDFLYSLKLATEQARLVMKPTTDEKLKLKVEFTTRRGEELKNVAQGNGDEKPGRVTQAAEILKRDLDTVKKQLQEVKSDGTSPQKVVEAAKLVDQTSNKLVQSLQDSKLDLPSDIKGKIIEAQEAAADTSVKAIEVLVEAHETSQDVVGEHEVVEALQGHTQVLVNITGDPAFASSTANLISSSVDATSTFSLPGAIEQIKVATQTAFANQKALENPLGAGSSTEMGANASSTASGATSTESVLPAPSSTSTSSTTTTSQTSTSSVRPTTTPPT